MTLHHPKTHSHTILKSYLIEYRRYAPKLMPILETRSEVKYTLTPRMIFDIPSSQDASTQQIWDSSLKLYKRYAPDTIILKTRSEVKVTMTHKWFTTLHHPKTHPHTKFGIPTSKNMRYTLDTIILKIRSEVNVAVT